jgi:DNA-binding response OmpR family regulator
VGVTGNALDDDVSNFIEAGADIVFSKPFNMKNLDCLLRYINAYDCMSHPGYKLFSNGNSIVQVEHNVSGKIV